MTDCTIPDEEFNSSYLTVSLFYLFLHEIPVIQTEDKKENAHSNSLCFNETTCACSFVRFHPVSSSTFVEFRAERRTKLSKQANKHKRTQKCFKRHGNWCSFFIITQTLLVDGRARRRSRAATLT